MVFDQWEKLLWGIEQGECVLFLGPELPLVPPSGERRQVPAEALAERLAGKLKPAPGGAAPAAGDLARIAQRFLAQEDEVGLEMELTRWHGELEGRRSALHDDLAELPFRLLVTSAHDPLIETALREAGKAPVVERYHYRGAKQELLPVPTVEAPILYHLYGHAAEPRSVVLAETQLLDFLSALIAGTPPLPHDLNAALTNGRLFLFLGFGLERWYLRILLHVLKVLRRGSRAFAVEAAEAGRVPGAEEAVLFYQENYERWGVYHTDVVEFVRELRHRYVPTASPGAGETAGTAAAAAPPPGAPKVFLCHASEDAAKAAEIFGALEAAGFAPWLDKESLRGGDQWDPLIEATIGEMDFVVVLNSRALEVKSRGRSYVNKEINVALEARKWRLERRYIIPVRIDDARLLKVLKGYNALDLREPNGLRDLVRAIRRQLAAR